MNAGGLRMTNTEVFNLGQQVLEAQSFSKLLGAELVEFKEGEVVFEIPIRENLLQHHGFVHGAVLSFAADNALTFVGGTVLGAEIITSEYKINYLRPAIGEKLIARGTVISSGRRQAVCRCDVFAVKDNEEKLCATAIGTIVTFTKGD